VITSSIGRISNFLSLYIFSAGKKKLDVRNLSDN